MTSELFHPKPLGAGEADPVMDGGMPSICRVMACPGVEASSTLPALSTLQNEMVCSPFSPWENGPE